MNSCPPDCAADRHHCCLAMPQWGYYITFNRSREVLSLSDCGPDKSCHASRSWGAEVGVGVGGDLSAAGASAVALSVFMMSHALFDWPIVVTCHFS